MVTLLLLSDETGRKPTIWEPGHDWARISSRTVQTWPGLRAQCSRFSILCQSSRTTSSYPHWSTG